jgi:hypothetical protein
MVASILADAAESDPGCRSSRRANWRRDPGKTAARSCIGGHGSLQVAEKNSARLGFTEEHALPLIDVLPRDPGEGRAAAGQEPHDEQNEKCRPHAGVPHSIISICRQPSACVSCADPGGPPSRSPDINGTPAPHFSAPFGRCSHTGRRHLLLLYDHIMKDGRLGAKVPKLNWDLTQRGTPPSVSPLSAQILTIACTGENNRCAPFAG